MLSQPIESGTRVFARRFRFFFLFLDYNVVDGQSLTNNSRYGSRRSRMSVTGMGCLIQSVRRRSDRRRRHQRFSASASSCQRLSAAAVAIAITVLLFQLMAEPNVAGRTDFLAGHLGSRFVIALQRAPILSTVRCAVRRVTSDAGAAYAHDPDSPIWWPAYARNGQCEEISLCGCEPCHARRR